VKDRTRRRGRIYRRLFRKKQVREGDRRVWRVRSGGSPERGTVKKGRHREEKSGGERAIGSEELPNKNGKIQMGLIRR